MNINSNSPIGIFDSGVGGLTVVDAVTRLLPNESIVYFGDTAHTPWGDKSTAAIQAYSVRICDMLLKQNCKLILVACNTASSAAYELVKEYIGNRAKVVDVIDPIVDHIRENYVGKTIGLIGTKQTVSSNIYKKKLDALDAGIQLQSLATPLLVPLIEEGFTDSKITEETIQQYLSQPALQNIEALILGCTHYPLIKNHIMKFYQQNITLIDACEIVAKAVQGLLVFHNLLNRAATPKRVFYVSDYTETFEEHAKFFFPKSIHLEQYPLWDN